MNKNEVKFISVLVYDLEKEMVLHRESILINSSGN